MFPAAITKVYRSQGGSYAIGTIIDGYLSQEEIDQLYAIWKSDWPEPLVFQGGVKAITCEMILEVPKDIFIAAFGRKKNRVEMASNILAKAERNI